jgi:hypothetical protein
MVKTEWDWAGIEAILQRLHERLVAARSTGGGSIARDLGEEMAFAVTRELDALKELVAAPLADQRIPCRACGQPVSAKATLCGHCWARLIPGSGVDARKNSVKD